MPSSRVHGHPHQDRDHRAPSVHCPQAGAVLGPQPLAERAFLGPCHPAKGSGFSRQLTFLREAPPGPRLGASRWEPGGYPYASWPPKEPRSRLPPQEPTHRPSTERRSVQDPVSGMPPQHSPPIPAPAVPPSSAAPSRPGSSDLRPHRLIPPMTRWAPTPIPPGPTPPPAPQAGVLPPPRQVSPPGAGPPSLLGSPLPTRVGRGRSRPAPIALPG